MPEPPRSSTSASRFGRPFPIDPPPSSVNVLTMQPDEPLPGQLPEPWVKGHRSVFQIIRELASSVSQGLLDHVGRIQPETQARVHPHRDPPFETRAMPLQQPLAGQVITLNSSCQQRIGLVTVVRHPDAPFHNKTNEK